MVKKFLGLFKNIYFDSLIILIILAYFFSQSQKPIIYSIPAYTKGAQIQLTGTNFGKNQGKSLILFKTKGKNLKLNHYIDWSDTLILFESPENFSWAEIRIIKMSFGFKFRSNSREIIQKLEIKGDYDVPVQQKSSWPTFRHDRRNTGFYPKKVRINKKRKPWFVQTGKGIFSTPVIDLNETIYLGSADHIFYAINSTGKILWTFKTGQIIDSGAALPASIDSSETQIIIPTGAGFLYKLRCKSGLLPQERIIWKFSAENAQNLHYNNWFEGNVAIGFKGEIYAGNTNFNYYCLNSAGRLNWKYKTTSNNWSQAAIGDDGTVYWASNDTYVRAVSPSGKELWRKRTLGFIAASVAIGSDGTVYIGSFDSYLYALNPFDGSVKWKFKTNDHIYASVALEPDSFGDTKRILFGSTDGFFYALYTDGSLAWKYYTDDVIRASAAIGENPENQQKNTVYFGCGNGKIYALDTQNGQMHWTFDTNSSNPELHDRNDLNASVALGKNGIYTASESGRIWFVPYDYPLYTSQNDTLVLNDTNLTKKDTVFWQFVSSGGNLLTDSLPKFSAFPILTLKLKVVKKMHVMDAFLCNTPIICSDKKLNIKIVPNVDFSYQKSADGHYLYLIPKEFWKAGIYTLKLNGDYYTGGWDIGNLKLGGSETGSFTSKLHFKISAPQKMQLSNDSMPFPVFEFTRITAPIPTMLASLNQIGFDYMDWALHIVKIQKQDSMHQKVLIWVQGIERDAYGNVHLKENSNFVFPLWGKFYGNYFVFEQKKMTMAITGIPIPFNRLLLSGEFMPDFSSQNKSLFANTKVLSIPTFGKYLVLAGLANDIYKNLLVSGSFMTYPVDSSWHFLQKPQNIHFESFRFIKPDEQDGNLIVNLSEKRDSLFNTQKHEYALCLYNTENLEPLYLNYKKLLQKQETADGKISSISLKIPADIQLPDKLGAILIVDLYPLKEIVVK